MIISVIRRVILRAIFLSRIPADMVLLRTSESNGTCFIRTDQLDGETDWKLRVAVPATQNMDNEQDLFSINAFIYADKPHMDIHSFIGTFTINGHQGKEEIPLRLSSISWLTRLKWTSVGPKFWCFESIFHEIPFYVSFYCIPTRQRVSN